MPQNPPPQLRSPPRISSQPPVIPALAPGSKVPQAIAIEGQTTAPAEKWIPDQVRDDRRNLGQRHPNRHAGPVPPSTVPHVPHQRRSRRSGCRHKAGMTIATHSSPSHVIPAQAGIQTRRSHEESGAQRLEPPAAAMLTKQAESPMQHMIPVTHRSRRIRRMRRIFIAKGDAEQELLVIAHAQLAVHDLGMVAQRPLRARR